MKSEIFMSNVDMINDNDFLKIFQFLVRKNIGMANAKVLNFSFMYSAYTESYLFFSSVRKNHITLQTYRL